MLQRYLTNPLSEGWQDTPGVGQTSRAVCSRTLLWWSDMGPQTKQIPEVRVHKPGTPPVPPAWAQRPIAASLAGARLSSHACSPCLDSSETTHRQLRPASRVAEVPLCPLLRASIGPSVQHRGLAPGPANSETRSLPRDMPRPPPWPRAAPPPGGPSSHGAAPTTSSLSSVVAGLVVTKTRR